MKPEVKNSLRRDLNVTLNRSELRRLMDTAHAFDLNKDGYFDARSGVVNLWCGPVDRPDCWDISIHKGGLDYPRALVGSLWFEWQEDETVKLYVEISPYDLIDAQRKVLVQKYKDYRRAVNDPLNAEQKRSCLDWCERKTKELIRLAELAPHVVGIKCPWCDFILKEGLLNDMVSHVRLEHDVMVTGIALSNPVILYTEKGQFRLENAEVFDA